MRVIEGVTPLYITFGNKGELFVTECWDHRYTVFDSQGQRILNVGSNGKPPFEDEGPTGIATDDEGNVYVASDHKVQKYAITTKSMCVTGTIVECRCLTPT